MQTWKQVAHANNKRKINEISFKGDGGGKRKVIFQDDMLLVDMVGEGNDKKPKDGKFFNYMKIIKVGVG